MRLRTTLLACIPLAALCSLLIAAPATASRGQVSIVQADRETVHSGQASSAVALSEFANLGAEIVKAQILWRDVAPVGRPADPTNPAAYDWSKFDMFVRNARARGLRPYLSLGGRAPDWASRRSCPGARAGTCRPSPRLFGQFVQAAARHYTGGDLHVVMWSFWNEPSLAFWLQPQRRRGVNIAAGIYRRLASSGLRGLRRAGHGGDRILLGELAPLGSRQRGLGAKTAPLAFIRAMACVNRRFQPLRRSTRRKMGCSRASLRGFNGFAMHPYTARLTPSRGNKGPRARARRDDATLRYLGRLKRTLDKSRRRLRTRRLGIWITEFGFQSKPPDEFGSSLRTVARYFDESEYIAYKSPRVKSVDQYTLYDDPVGTSGNTFRDFEGFQLGIRFAQSGPFVEPQHSFGARKPFVYDAYRMPFFVKVKRRRPGGRVEIFGGVRAKRLRESFVTIDTARPGQPFRRLRTIRLNARGYFRRSFRLSRATRRTYRLTSTETGQVREKRAVRR